MEKFAGKHLPELLMLLALCLTALLAWQAKRMPAAQDTPARPLPEQGSEQADEPPVQTAGYDARTQLRLLVDGTAQEMTLRDYLTGALLAEMPASFEPQALQAQAVASRTFALAQRRHDDAQVCADSGCCQAWLDEAALRQRLGADYDAAVDKAHAALDATDGEVLCSGGALITAAFFSCSGGRTEDAVAVWGSDVPYLQAVDSPGEEIYSGFSSEAVFTPEEFAGRLAGLADLQGLDPAQWLGNCTETDGGGVAEQEIGGTAFSGTQLRQLFGLRSTRFTLRYDGDGFRFDVQGYGHRVGMSQYGAQAMALQGADYREILLHYYTGVEICRADTLTVEPTD